MNLSYPIDFNNWNEEEMKSILKVLRTGNFVMGENISHFETQFATKMGSKYAVMVNSGSAAALAAVASLMYRKDRPLKAGDEVIVPALGWATTYYPLQMYGLKLKVVDIELDSLNIDTTKLDTAISHRTKAILAFNMMGNPAALDNLKAFAKRHSLWFIEDNCQSMGAELRGRKAGAWGDLGLFSFAFSNQASTMEGGMILTDDKESYQLLRCLRNYGSTKNVPPESGVYEKRTEDFPNGWRFILPGFNLRPLEICGAIGLEQFRKFESMLEVRRLNAALFQETFGNDSRFILQKENGKSSWYGFSLVLSPEVKVERTKILEALTQTGIGYGPIGGGNILRQDVIMHFQADSAGPIVNANTVHDRGFYVGNYPADLTKQFELLHKTLTKVVAVATPKKPGYPSAA